MSYDLKAILNLFNDTKCNNKITQMTYHITCNYGITLKNCYNSYFKILFNETFNTNICYNRTIYNNGTIYNNETSFDIKLINEDINKFAIILLSVTLFVFVIVISFYIIKKCNYNPIISYRKYNTYKGYSKL